MARSIKEKIYITRNIFSKKKKHEIKEKKERMNV